MRFLLARFRVHPRLVTGYSSRAIATTLIGFRSGASKTTSSLRPFSHLLQRCMNLDKYLFELLQATRVFVVCADQRNRDVTTEFVGNCHRNHDPPDPSFAELGFLKSCHSITSVLRLC